MIEFATPLWLLALPLPYLLWAVKKSIQASSSINAGFQATAILHPQADLLAELDNSEISRKQLPWLWLVGCILLLMALARPQWFDHNAPGSHQGHDIMLAIDISGSMRAQDFIIDGVATSRLDMLKGVVKNFIGQRHNDRIGLIVFADDAMTFMPMTTDINMISRLIDDIKQGIAGEKTALGDAIALAVERLRIRDTQSPILMLLTDGTNTAGAVSPQAATTLARHNGVRIYTIGIGTNNIVPFPRGPVMKPLLAELPLDEQQLQTIAAETGGQYYHAENTTALKQIFSDIDRLETSELADPGHPNKQEWYWLPLLLGLALLWSSEHRTRHKVLP